MTDLPDYLPPAARDLAEVIGLAGLLRLVDAFPGTHRRVPGKVRPGHPLAKALTGEQYKALVGVYRNEEIYIPKLESRRAHLRRIEARRLESEGKTRAQIAIELGVTERTIYNDLAGQDDNQIGMF